jgi:hypothetical protein
MPLSNLGEWKYRSTFLGLGTRWRCGKIYAPVTLSPGKDLRYPLDRRLLGGHRFGLDAVEWRKMLHCRESNPGLLSCSPSLSRLLYMLYSILQIIVGSVYLLIKAVVTARGMFCVHMQHWTHSLCPLHALSCSAVLPGAAWAMFMFPIAPTKGETVWMLPDYRSVVVHVDSRPKPTSNH